MAQVTLSECCDQAARLVQAGQIDWAIRTVRHALLYYPRYIEGHQLLGQLLLEAGNHPEATVQFRRVLSADPEHVAAWVALSSIHQAAGDVDNALEHMRRACDLAPSDADLRRRLDSLAQTYLGDAAGQPEFTRPALGRIYARNGLYAKAIQEFRAVLVEEPARSDVQIALAETLWRDGRCVEAAELCHTILASLPHALKANLILAAIQLNNGQSEAAQSYLSSARALDPENSVAQAFFGEASPLAPQVVKVEQLEETGAESGALAVSLMPVDGPPRLSLEPARDGENEIYQEETARMSESDRAGEDLEIPDWLKGVGDDLLAEETVAQQPPRPPGDAAAADLDLATRLSRLTEGEIAAQAAAAGEVAPALAREAEPSPKPETEIPVWLMGSSEPVSLIVPETQAHGGEVNAAELPATEVPEWLRELQQSGVAPGESTAEVAPPASPAATTTAPAEEAEMPDWLRRLRDDSNAAVEAEPAYRLTAELPEIQADTPIPEGALPAEEIIAPEPTVQEPPEPPMQAEERLPEPLSPELTAAAPVMPAVAAAEGKVTPTPPPAELEVGPPAELPAGIEGPGAVTAPVTGEPVSAEPATPAEDVSKESAERLILARQALESGQWREALAAYTVLVNSAEALDRVMADLEEGVRQHPDDSAGYQLLGDAYVRDGRLPAALQAYRTALVKLY
jgi:tetratricopeptide (TPR) repeat protein